MDEKEAEEIANLTSEAAKRAWEKAKECKSFNQAAEIYSFALIEEVYRLIYRSKNDSNS